MERYPATSGRMRGEVPDRIPGPGVGEDMAHCSQVDVADQILDQEATRGDMWNGSKDHESFASGGDSKFLQIPAPQPGRRYQISQWDGPSDDVEMSGAGKPAYSAPLPIDGALTEVQRAAHVNWVRSTKLPELKKHSPWQKQIFKAKSWVREWSVQISRDAPAPTKQFPEGKPFIHLVPATPLEVLGILRAEALKQGADGSSIIGILNSGSPNLKEGWKKWTDGKHGPENDLYSISNLWKHQETDQPRWEDLVKDPKTCIHVPEVMIFASSKFQDVIPYYVSVFTCVPPSNPKTVPSNVDVGAKEPIVEQVYAEEDEMKDMATRITRVMYSAAQDLRIRKIILYPIGCGVLTNPAAGVAQAFLEALVTETNVYWGDLNFEVYIAIKETNNSNINRKTPLWDAFSRRFSGCAKLCEENGTKWYERVYNAYSED